MSLVAAFTPIAALAVGMVLFGRHQLNKRRSRKQPPVNHTFDYLTGATVPLVGVSGLEEFDRLLALAVNIHRNTDDPKVKQIIECEFAMIKAENPAIALPPLLTGSECCMLMALVDEEMGNYKQGDGEVWKVIHDKLEGTARTVADPFDSLERIQWEDGASA